TGYIDQAGFNFAATAQRDETRLISIVMGIHTDSYYRGLEVRADESRELLEYGFTTFQPHTMMRTVFDEMRVWFSSEKFTLPEEALLPEVLLSDSEMEQVSTVVTLQEDIIAPLEPGAVIGSVEYYLDDFLLASTDVVLPDGLEKGPWYRRFQDWMIRSWADFKLRFEK
ncbi:MAG: hypothetical protein PQJ50_01745, partial [Spirochaetales bacterium]|nr:hypothetical protein [Spirochaetales bacterium]